MSITGGNIVAAASSGTLVSATDQADAPVIVTLTDDGTGNSFTAAVTGTGTIQLYYKALAASAWTAGETRFGSGDIQQTVPVSGWYECYATANDGGTESGASNIKSVHIASIEADSIEDAIVIILKGSIDVTDLVGERIFPLRVPQDQPMPAITYQQLSDDKIQTHSGPDTLLNTRMQIDCWATIYDQASAIKKAVRLALAGYIGTVAGRKISNIIMENSTDLDRQRPGTNKLDRYAKSLDFIIVFNEAST